MSVIRRLLPVMAILLLLATGCRSHKEASRPATPNTSTQTTDTSSTEVTPTYTPHYYTANFTGAAQGYTVNGQLRVQSDSIIWLSGSKVIELARARFTHDSVLIYAKIVNRSFQGSYIDLYKRFKYRTSFDELYQMIMSDNAEAQLTTIFGKLGLEATIHLDPLKEVDHLSFPMYIPDKTNPL